MHKTKTKILIAFLAVFIGFTTLLQAPKQASADLLVSPLRVSFEGRERSKTVTLINQSTEQRVYRIEWLENAMNERGNYDRLEGELPADHKGASDLIRFSPRQITLNPGERQVVRLAVRKPATIEDGEYRSHMVFKQLADIEDASSHKGLGVKLFVNISVSIPVIVRHGETSINAKIESIEKKYDQNVEAHGFALKLSRKGSASSYGSLRVYDVNDKLRQRPLAQLNNVSIFPEIDKRDAFIIEEDRIPSSITDVVVVYEGRGEYENLIFDEKNFKLR